MKNHRAFNWLEVRISHVGSSATVVVVVHVVPVGGGPINRTKTNENSANLSACLKDEAGCPGEKNVGAPYLDSSYHDTFTKCIYMYIHTSWLTTCLFENISSRLPTNIRQVP